MKQDALNIYQEHYLRLTELFNQLFEDFHSLSNEEIKEYKEEIDKNYNEIWNLIL